MKKACFYFVLITIISAIASCGNKKVLLKKAEQSNKDHNYRQTILICNEILSWDSTIAEAYDYRGFAFVQLKDYKSASRDFTSSIHFNPTGWEGYMYRARVLVMQERYEYSLPDFQHALDNAPRDTTKATILVQRAMVWYRLRHFEKDIEDSKAALRYLPHNKYALDGLGGGLMETGRFSEAISCFEEVIKIDSTFEGGYLNLGYIYGLMGRYRESLDMCNKELAIYPNQPYALNNRGYAYMQLDDLDGAIQDINRSIQLMPGNSYAFRNRGLVYLRLKMNDQACDDFHTALKLDFTRYYGNELEELVKEYCAKK